MGDLSDENDSQLQKWQENMTFFHVKFSTELAYSIPNASNTRFRLVLKLILPLTVTEFGTLQIKKIRFYVLW